MKLKPISQIDSKIVASAMNHRELCIRERLMFEKVKEIQARPKEDKKIEPRPGGIAMSKKQMDEFDKALAKK